MPDDHQLGYGLNKLNRFTGGPRYGFILVPAGFPRSRALFEVKCLPIAFSVGKMIYETAQMDEQEVKRLLHQLRGLSSQKIKSVNDKMRNKIGDKIWQNTQTLMMEIMTPSADLTSMKSWTPFARRTTVKQ